MQIKLSEVIEAIEETDVEQSFFYYIPEERIISGEDCEDISDRQLIPLPSHKQIDEYGTMRSFIEEKCDGEAAEWLQEAIRGAGAFRRFRNALDRFGLNEQWYAYRDEVHESLAIEWCEYYGIEYLEQEPFAKQTAPVTKETPSDARHNYRFINIDTDNVYGLVYLAVEFRKTLAAFKNEICDIDVDDALEELQYYLSRHYPIFAVADNGRYVGYAVCRIDDDVVWLESIYVRKQDRHKGIGKILFQKAESIAREHGNETLYQYVHPNNDAMLLFLKSQGYDVLNLIEIRKPYTNEETKQEYQIGDHKYRY